MNIDVEGHLGAVERSVSRIEREGRPASAVVLARTFGTTAGDLWNAVTSAERIPRWFLPIRGELKAGGRFQLEGNAGGAITACEPPAHCALTWEFGGDTSWVDLRVADDGAGRARPVLTHTSRLSDHWKRYGPGAARRRLGDGLPGARAPSRATGRAETGRSRLRRRAGGQGVRRRQQRGMGEGGGRGRRRPRRRAGGGGAHRRVLHGRTGAGLTRAFDA